MFRSSCSNPKHLRYINLKPFIGWFDLKGLTSEAEYSVCGVEYAPIITNRAETKLGTKKVEQGKSKQQKPRSNRSCVEPLILTQTHQCTLIHYTRTHTSRHIPWHTHKTHQHTHTHTPMYIIHTVLSSLPCLRRGPTPAAWGLLGVKDNGGELSYTPRLPSPHHLSFQHTAPHVTLYTVGPPGHFLQATTRRRPWALAGSDPGHLAPAIHQLSSTDCYCPAGLVYYSPGKNEGALVWGAVHRARPHTSLGEGLV